MSSEAKPLDVPTTSDEDYDPNSLYDGLFDFGEDWRLERYCIAQAILKTDCSFSYEDGVLRYQELDWPDGYCTYLAVRRNFTSDLALHRHVFQHFKERLLWFPWEESFREAMVKAEEIRAKKR